MPQSQPLEFTTGLDGALWFTELLGHKIGRISTSGVITEVPLPNEASPSVTAGPDGALWFTEAVSACGMGRITVDGAIAEFSFPTPDSQPNDITVGPDGNLWFSERGATGLGA